MNHQPSSQQNKPLSGMKPKEIIVTVAVMAVVVTALLGTLFFTSTKKSSGPVYQRLSAEEFEGAYQAFLAASTVEMLKGVPVVEPAPGADIYLKAYSFGWEPILRLRKSVIYRLHLYSVDTLHGFALPKLGIRFEIPPGQEMVSDIAIRAVGTYEIICDEFCGKGHHDMRSHLTVVP